MQVNMTSTHVDSTERGLSVQPSINKISNIFFINFETIETHLLNHRLAHSKYKQISSEVLPLYNFLNQCKSLLDKKLLDYHLEWLNNLTAFQGKIVESASHIDTTVACNIGNSNNLLNNLSITLLECRKDENFIGEYLTRKLFVSLVLSTQTNLSEEIFTAIKFEVENLETFPIFSEIPLYPNEKFEVHEVFNSISGFKNFTKKQQESYYEHLGNYLDLLAKLLKYEYRSDFTLHQKFGKTIQLLDNYQNKLLKSNQNIPYWLSKNLCYLRSRPEWFFYNDSFLAKKTLLKTLSSESNEVNKLNIEFDLITLDFHRERKNHDLSQKSFLDLLKRILNLLSNTNLIASDRVALFSIGVKVYESVLNLNIDNPEKQIDLVKKIKKTLERMILLGTTQGFILNFSSLHLVAKSRFCLGFYCTLCSESTEEFNKGVELLSSLQTDFWVDASTKMAGIRLLDCLQSIQYDMSMADVKTRPLSFLSRFKHLLLGEMDSFFNSNRKPEIIKPFEKNDVENHALLWNYSKEFLARYFLQGNEKELSNFVNLFSRQIYSHSLLAYNDYLKVPRFYSISVKENHIILDSDQNGIRTFLSQAKALPFMTEMFFNTEEKFLEEEWSQFQIVGYQNGVQKKNACNYVEEPSNVASFRNLYEKIMNILIDYQGNLEYVNVVEDMMQQYMKVIISSDTLFDLCATPPKDLKKQNRDKILSLRYDLVSLESGCYLFLEALNYFDTYIFDDEDNLQYSNLSVLTQNAIDLIKYAKPEALNFFELKLNVISRLLFRIENKAPKDKIEAIWVTYLHAKALMIVALKEENPEAMMTEANDFYKDMPNTYNEIVAYFFSTPNSQRPSSIEARLEQLILYKAIHLNYIQNVEEAIPLYERVLKNVALKSLHKFAKHQNQKIQHSQTFYDIMPFEFYPNKVKNNEIFYHKNDKEYPAPMYLSEKFQPIESYPLDPDTLLFSDPSESISLKKEILQNASSIIERQQRKKEIKEVRLPSSRVTKHSLTENKSISPLNPTNAYVNKDAMIIFNSFFEKNNESQRGPWELLSFRNDIKIKKKQVLQLILSLGGTYDARRGHGSHVVAHLPKITFHGRDVGGIVDWETGELMVTLTNEEELKCYQIIQFRKILLKQGFNPDTVKELQNKAE